MPLSCEFYKVVKRVEEPQGWALQRGSTYASEMEYQLFYQQANINYPCHVYFLLCQEWQELSDLMVFPLCRWLPRFLLA